MEAIMGGVGIGYPSTFAGSRLLVQLVAAILVPFH